MIYTKQQIRGAILRAADHIEANPSLYVYRRIHLPGEGNQGGANPYLEIADTGCMWGWIGHFLGMKDVMCRSIALAVCGKGPEHLYDVCPVGHVLEAVKAVAGMRSYANKYFPAEDRAPSRADLVPVAEFNRWLDLVRSGVKVSEPA